MEPDSTLASTNDLLDEISLQDTTRADDQEAEPEVDGLPVNELVDEVKEEEA